MLFDRYHLSIVLDLRLLDLLAADSELVVELSQIIDINFCGRVLNLELLTSLIKGLAYPCF